MPQLAGKLVVGNIFRFLLFFLFWKIRVTSFSDLFLFAQNWVSYGICVVVRTLYSAQIFDNPVFKWGAHMAWNIYIAKNRFSVLCSNRKDENNVSTNHRQALEKLI